MTGAQHAASGLRTRSGMAAQGAFIRRIVQECELWSADSVRPAELRSFVRSMELPKARWGCCCLFRQSPRAHATHAECSVRSWHMRDKLMDQHSESTTALGLLSTPRSSHCTSLHWELAASTLPRKGSMCSEQEGKLSAASSLVRTNSCPAAHGARCTQDKMAH